MRGQKDALDACPNSETSQEAVEQGQNAAPKFVSCHTYQGGTVNSSSPAHWHKEVEIMHFVEGTGFTHTCQCKGETFDAPAIVIVPSGLIHRTCYGPNCKVNRILFKADSLRLHEADKALESCLKNLRGIDARGSMIFRSTDMGFNDIVQALESVENLGDHDESQTYDPSKAQEDAIKQDKVDAYVAATFANIGSKADLTAAQSESLLAELTNVRNKRLLRKTLCDLEAAYNGDVDSRAINAGSIAIALAQNFAPGLTRSKNDMLAQGDAYASRGRQSPEEECRMIGLSLQLKARLLNFFGEITKYGYFSEVRIGRKPRATRYNDEKIKELLKHIHDNYNTPMNITELANMLQVTNQYFCRYFKQLTDMSFIDYLNDLRLQKAAHDIATTNQSIREISTRHGFDTIGYFFKLFRERYGTTPIGYRNRFMAAQNGEEMGYKDAIKD